MVGSSSSNGGTLKSVKALRPACGRTGESDLTWQAHVGFGYQATDSFNIVASYRFLRWEFDDDARMSDLDFSGPMLGAVFRF